MATLVFGDIMIIIGFTIDGDFAAEGAGVIIGLAPYLEAAVNRVELANLPFSDTALIIAALFQQNPNWTSSFAASQSISTHSEIIVVAVTMQWWSKDNLDNRFPNCGTWVVVFIEDNNTGLWPETDG